MSAFASASNVGSSQSSSPSPAISRRSFVSGAAGVAGAAAAAGIAASGLPLTHAVAADDPAAAYVPSFLVKPEPVTEFSAEYNFDVVVVGAGISGLAAIHTALEAGASVACLQNADTPFTSGNMGTAIDLSKTSEAAVQACVSFINWKSDFRSNRDLVEVWAHNSWEATSWWAEASAAGGVETKEWEYTLEYNGYTVYLRSNTYFHIDGVHNTCAQAIAPQLEEAGARFFYGTPAVQLVTSEDGAVTGVVGQTADGSHIKVNAAKGVILCTGDYTGNPEMCDYYCPDVKGFENGVFYRDGSGFAMGMWAGAHMVPVNHTKMIHGEPFATRLEMPFLFVNLKGERFMEENCGGRMGYLNNYQCKTIARNGYQNPIASKFFSIIPNNWEDYYDEWKAGNYYEISRGSAYRDVNPEKWIKADTLEELAEGINAYLVENEFGVDPMDVDTFVATVERYNELCAKGEDDDFGKDPKYLVPIDSAPYYAAVRGSHRKSSVLSGLETDGNGQCLDDEFQPIPGLYAAGNASGQFFGGVDYPMNIEGLSIGRAVTSGYVLGRYVASL